MSRYQPQIDAGSPVGSSCAAISRIWEMPNKHTFKMKCVQSLLTRYGVPVEQWADPFSGLYSPAVYRNDADAEANAEFNLDGLEFLRQWWDGYLDGVLFDPPYSVEQALRIYKPKHNGTAGRAEYWARCKDEIGRIVKPGGKAICFGWDSTGIGDKRGFQLDEVLLICHGALHNDTIVTVETKR